MSAPAAHVAASPYRRLTPTVWQLLGQALWQTLERAAQRRASRELNGLARHWDRLDPDRAALMRAAAVYSAAPRPKD